MIATKNIPRVHDIKIAVDFYHRYPELSNNEIKILFNTKSSSSIARLKRYARDEMTKQNIPSYSQYNVNTKIAYVAWNIDVDDLENRMKKLKEMKAYYNRIREKVVYSKEITS